MDEETILTGMMEALRFYRDSFEPEVSKKVRGITYKPSEKLLDDCGQKALEALQRYEKWLKV